MALLAEAAAARQQGDTALVRNIEARVDAVWDALMAANEGTGVKP